MLSPGFHSFHDVIGRAMYDPAGGYYARRVQTVGRAGDFSTSATLGTAMARAVARWAVGAAGTGRGKIRHLIEIGAGDGSMAAGVLRALPWWHPLRRGYAIVDSSAPLRARQREKLGGKVRWFDTVEAALAAAGGRALLMGHELIDAFPPRALVWSDRAWRELGLEITPDGRVGERTVPWNGPDFPSVALEPENWPGGAPAEGQRIEHLQSFAAWMAGWAPRWRAGSCLWVDYGADFPELYHRRPHGTLRAYHRHQRLEGMDVFRRLGQQDITCDVNFTDLRAWGEHLGWRTRQMVSQGEFLRAHGATGSGDAAASAGAADAFQVLVQECGGDG